MSGNGYSYYYPQGVQNFPAEQNQSWDKWALEQHQQFKEPYGRNMPPHHNSTPPIANQYPTPRSQNFYNTNNNRHYQHQPRRFPNANMPYPHNQQQNWPRNNYNNRRPRPQDSPGENLEPKAKAAKKKKKPLSQNVPSKKDWTMEEAETALAVEKEYNKRYKNHSLIIKFPDLELNRDIVSKFHSSIENVHFQQPSTPRFCFVTLQESADADSVITALNQIKFGEGYLTAEYKKDREEDQNIGPEDIDPCTLYVGNLAQEITKEDMVKTYPKQRRIDIGYAKKMKYTRYAFVSFKNVTDSIEAFKKTHSTQMYSKSLIVRFRRLHGTVGMPGESKPQSPAKSKPDSAGTNEQTNNDRTNAEEVITQRSHDVDISATSETNSLLGVGLDFSVVKQEIHSSDEDDESIAEKKPSTSNFISPFMEGSIDIAMKHHRPIIKKEIKQEVDEDSDSLSFLQSDINISANSSIAGDLPPIQYNNGSNITKTMIKNEVNDFDNESDDEGGGGIGDVNFGSLLNQLEDHSNQIEFLRRSVP